MRDPGRSSSCARLRAWQSRARRRRATRCGSRAASAHGGGTRDRGTSGPPARGRRTPASALRGSPNAAPSTPCGRSRRKRRAADRRAASRTAVTVSAPAGCSRARDPQLRAAEGEASQVDVHHRHVCACRDREGRHREPDRAGADDEDGGSGRERCAPHGVRADAERLDQRQCVDVEHPSTRAASAPAAPATRACRRRRARRAPAVARSSCRGRGGRPNTRRSSDTARQRTDRRAANR